jgi:hypothetical protein
VRIVELGEPEIDDLGDALGATTARQEDVLGFQVAVDDAGLVRLGEAHGGFAGDLQHVLRLEPSFPGQAIV